MRTTEQIKKEMTDAVLADATLRDTFGLTQDQEWDTQVSSVSILNLIIYITAMAIRTLEWLHDRFKQEVEERIAAAFPGTISWYWNKVMQFRYGYDVNQYGVYEGAALEHPEALIITHCAVMEVDNGILVKVNKGTGTFEPLTPSEQEALKAYVDTVKFAGTTARIWSYRPDELRVKLYVWRDPQVLELDDDGRIHRRTDGAEVVKDAVAAYLNSIAYGGVFNKTKLIDAVQQVEGVRDVTIRSGHIYTHNDNTDNNFAGFGQNFTSHAGHITIGGYGVVCLDPDENQ